MKPILLLGASLVILVVLISAATLINRKAAIPESHREIVLRDIGHKLLLHAKDSTSRVLPVKQIDGHTYQLAFQNSFGFMPDTLISLVQAQFKQNRFPGDYTVRVLDCGQRETIYAFEISAQNGNLTPCNGRKQEVGCYLIQIEFLPTGKFITALWWLLLIPLLAAGFYISKRFRKKQVPEPVADDKHHTIIGKFRFYAASSELKIGSRTIVLSEKETKALTLFAANRNEIVDRERMMKEIWEDEGIVVISRNVDVLVSKLRKKLSDDPSIKIINIHGRGYKFVVE